MTDSSVIVCLSLPIVTSEVIYLTLSVDPSFFHEALDRLHRQHEMATSIVEQRPIGMLTVDATDMKAMLIPNPLRCLDVRLYPSDHLYIP